ncbi:3-methylcrotonoyl-CoA carboxylase subunit alpha [Ktedonobacter sp. SOSP1-85]|uniref:acetyl/propionyl/methylcrotonyl-CoA carboxylase subunit alpha n=1 Tax=Ktedonobacter sp. SOSP1-85 TaxID=2778367 RepID=UPI001915AA16|nr:acetyl/propionyl/methylcrotonyl-CoA carboxylase subunit alpha [Ktedonobacter sp. SOSP1-85]GHO77082.1 3-methylcrotonoyl-CoA carboxylase subunit alpha [Ktedonobacter sp. SOSP1-85]
MFKKILIANRGEIAVRIQATCREIGIRTVAIYSDVDRQARHVREADEAYRLGPAPASESYLRGDIILEIARQCGAEAIHPGYGFLSENANFAEACEQAGIVFIGPPASAMRLMGSKIAAKQIAERVGAPVVPGYNGERQDADTLLAEAEHIGFPLLIKASAGGGGKGMRVVNSLQELPEQLAGAQREAGAAFGDDTVFLERLILRPRHVEIQVLGDKYGTLVYLGERECSIQRRHQKIVEESPSVALTPRLRAEMGEAAVRIASAAGYVNAGTLEFMLDDDGNFYFLEMNTRLQVEHPVTELVTGLDLVRHQLLIASGEPLAFTQEQITTRGHAIEVRLYAEDPQQQFLPSTGTVELFAPPQGPGIRVDSGVESGDEVTQYYDPMLAKLIVYGEHRLAALERLSSALEQTALLGVTTNLSLLQKISTNTAFREGQTHTSFLDEQDMLAPTAPEPLPAEVLIVAALADIAPALSSTSALTGASPWQSLGPWRMPGGSYTRTYLSTEQRHTITLTPLWDTIEDRHTFAQSQNWRVSIDDGPQEHISCLTLSAHSYLLTRAGQQSKLAALRKGEETLIVYRGESYTLEGRRAPDIATTAHGSGQGNAQKTLKAPMAGTLVKIQAHSGEQVEAHQVLAVLSAMKMEHSIIAPYAGRVQRINYQEGAVVPGGAVIIEIE